MAARTLVLFTAAGLGLAGGAVHLVTLHTASPGPSGRVRPLVMPALGPPPTGSPIPVAIARPGPAPIEDPPPAAASAIQVIAGVVVDEEGEGVEGLQMVGAVGTRRAHGTCYPGYSWGGESGPGGRFEFKVGKLPPPGNRDEFFNLSVNPWLVPTFVHGTAEQWAVLESGGALRDLRIVVRWAARIVGRVLRPDGMPAPGANVALHRASAPADCDQWTETGRDGCYWFNGLDPRDEFSITAWYGEKSGARVDLRGVLAPGECTEVNLGIAGLRREDMAAEGTFLFSGTVVDENGAPVPGAVIGGNWVRSPGGRGGDPLTQADGRFEGLLIEIPGPDRGDAPWDDLLCEVRKEGFGTRAVRATRADAATLEAKGFLEGVRVVLRRGAVVGGRVLTPEGEVIPGAEIEVADLPGKEDPPSAGWERFRADAHGAYRIPDLDAECGRFLYVHAEGRKSEWFSLRGRLVAGEEVVLDLVLSPAKE